ncbi:hypothetical protein GCM10023107_39200 [Actinoplanes octamycinicus]|nr:hypothetical protein Aoc01nite_68410 [Actinoplanes octamycinicus]
MILAAGATVRVTSFVTLGLLLAAGLVAPASAAEADPVRLDVGLSAGTDPAVVVDALGDAVVTTRPVPGLDAITIDVPADRIDAALTVLAATEGVRYADRGAVVGADSEVLPYALVVSEVPQAWTWTAGKPGITVAVVDSGVNVNLDMPATRLAAGYDFVDGDAAPADSDGHGTMMANVIAAQRGGGVGTIGVCSACSIMPVRVLSSGRGTTADAAAGIAWAADHGARVINASFSTASPSRLLLDAVEHANAKGALVVASAGNVYSAAHRYPAAYEPALAVTEHDRYFDYPEKNTEDDQWVDVTAYGGSAALGKDGEIGYAKGSSGATAVASGVAALAFSMRPDATAAEVNALIRRDADRQANYVDYHPPQVDAAQVVYDLGGTDTAPPTITETGLTDGQLIGAAGTYVPTQVTDDHGVEHVDLIVGGQVAATRTELGRSIPWEPPTGYNGPLPVTVVAYDYAGNTASATTTVQVDSVQPTVTLVSPAQTDTVHGTTVDITVEASSDTKSIVAQWQGSNPAYSLNPIPGTDRWTGKASLSPEGQFGLDIWDKAGNYTTFSHAFAVDNDPPAGGTIAPASWAKVRGTFVSTLTGVTDASGIAKAELWADGRYLGADTTLPYALPVPTGSYTGTFQLTWRVTDRLGQERTLPARTLVADNTAPTVKITKAPKNNAKVSGTVKIYVSAYDASGVARVELLVNGKLVTRDTTAGYLLKLNTKKQKKTMKVQVRVYDKLGNVRYTSVRTWHRR